MYVFRCALMLLSALLLSTFAMAAAPSTDSASYPSVPSVPYSYTSPDKSVPYNVAVFRDVLPWGDDRVDQILMDHGISFTVFGSADIPTVNLGGFDKVILCSSQPDTFIQQVQSYRYFFNSYASNGGYVLASLAHQSISISAGTNYPGYSQFTAFDVFDNPTIVEPGHAVFHDPNTITEADLSGWSASTHGSLTMYDGTALLHNDDGTIALAEVAFGDGYVMATTQTFEFLLADYDAAENLVLHQVFNPDTPLRVAVFRDNLPWGISYVDDALQANNIPYTVFNSSDIGVADLSPFDKVMLANDQGTTFINAVLANTSYFEDYVAAGGVLVNGMSQQSTNISPGAVYPGGVVLSEFLYSTSLQFLMPGSRIFNAPNPITEPDLDFGWSHHAHVTVSGGATLALSTVDTPGPVLIEHPWGDGMIVSSTITYPLISQEFTENVVLYMPRSFPAITDISDVGNDQGRQVRITWDRSGYDFPGSGVEISGYEIHRRQDAHKAAGWDFLMTVPAHGDAEYQAVVPTLCDSTISDGMCESAFFVKAVTASPYAYFETAVATGYSVDNLAPSAPTNLLLTVGQLSWDKSPAKDFDYFTVYGSSTPDLTGAVVVGHTTGTNLAVSGAGHAYLLVTATDFAGNESSASTPASVSAVGDTPTAFRLLGAVPNPFNPSTSIKFELPGDRVVNLRIYDASGRLVRELLSGSVMKAGPHGAVWDGRDATGRAQAAGVYIYRLTAGSDTDTGRMLLLK